MFTITHVNRDIYGDISEVMLDTGDVLNYFDAFDLASRGQIAGVEDSHNEEGFPTIRESYQDFTLMSLPSF